MTAVSGADDRHMESFWAPLEATPGAIVVTNEEGDIVFVNEEAARMFGRSQSNLVETPAMRLLATRSQAGWTERVARLLSARKSNDATPGDDLFGHRNGEEFPVDIALGYTTVAGAARAIAVFRDTSERRDVEQRYAVAAREAGAARAWLEAILEAAPAVILAVNPRAEIEYINRVLPQYTKEQVLGSYCFQYFPPDLQSPMRSALDSVLATGSSQTFECVTLAPDGGNIWFLSQLEPIRSGGLIVGAVVVATDITSRKRTETELLAARRMAVLGTLAAGVAHEINTPVQFVGDSLSFVRESSQDLLGLIERFQTIRRGLGEGRPVEEAIAEAVVAEEQADLTYIRAQMPVAIDRCIDGLNRVTAIVRSLKEFAHPADREMAAIDLNHAIESTLTIATNEYKYVADLERDLGELPPVVCHVGEICQVVLNIVVNAAHAIGDVVRGSDRRGIIRVRTRSAGDTAVITISDTGGGIPEGVRARIFDPFFTTKGVGKGTGQGLAIALSTVKEKHGGELTFDTGAQGTTFFIRLPIFGKPKGESDGDPPEATGSSGARGSPVTGSIIGIRS